MRKDWSNPHGQMPLAMRGCVTYKMPRPMKQYRPDVERQKWLYSMMLSRRIMRRWQGKPEVNTAIAAGKKQIPDNSEPWLPGGVRSVADALWISDQIKKTAEQWRIPLPPPN